MIATVRIAPVERWCEANLRDLEEFPHGAALVGMQVEIEADRMQFHANGCDGKVWPLTEQSFQQVRKIVPESDDDDLWLCEHMLEMD